MFLSHFNLNRSSKLLSIQPFYATWFNLIIDDNKPLVARVCSYDLFVLGDFDIWKQGAVGCMMIRTIDSWRKCTLFQSFPAADKILDELIAEDPLNDLSWCFGTTIIVITWASFDTTFQLPCIHHDGIRYPLNAILEEFSFDCKIFSPMHSKTI